MAELLQELRVALPGVQILFAFLLTLVFQALVVAGAAVVVLLSLDTVRDDRLPSGEYFFLLLASVSGALTLAAARDLLTLVVALEVVSLPAFALVALRRDDPRAGEAALKLFLVSVVSTAVMLFGLSLVYIDEVACRGRCGHRRRFLDVVIGLLTVAVACALGGFCGRFLRGCCFWQIMFLRRNQIGD